MRVTVVMTVLLTVASSQDFSSRRPIWPEYSHYSVKQNQMNKALDDKKLFKILKENHKKMSQKNQENQNGAVSFDAAFSKFTDQVEDDRTMKQNKNLPRTTFIKEGIMAKKNFDWRTQGVVTQVKNEGLCGAGWAFSTIGAVEGQLAIKKGRLIPLSEQQLIDCSLGHGNRGCQGGYIDQAYKYLMDSKGVVPSSSYPYIEQNKTCNVNEEKIEAQIIGIVDIFSGDEDALKKAVSSMGPVSAMIQADLRQFKEYKSGVYNDTMCTGKDLDHAVLVVGYGTTTEGLDYWTIKNSWGTEWGESGYMRMSRNRDNLCGIATKASFPIIK